jgi:hypothetical protein
LTNGHTRRPRRCLLDLSELHEASLIADLVHSGIDDQEPDPVELAFAPILTHWSVAVGPRLIGVDEWSAVLVLDVWSISRCRTWAQTSEGVVRLRDQSRLPLAKETRR